ncbi:MAG: hypothetical protein KC944_11870, partial [Candidatus Omnitrophica bacterium]|nr:hypothetical protein [Candidatus Omnitrophota bacterium]
MRFFGVIVERKRLAPYLRIGSRIAGILLALAAVLVIRCGHLIAEAVDKRSFWGHVLFLPQPRPLWENFPPTFLFGCVLAALSILFFGLSLKRSEDSKALFPQIKDPPSIEKSGQTLESILCVMFITILSGGFFYVVEWKQLVGFAPVVFWVLSILVPSLLLFRRDRNEGVNLRVSLNILEWVSIAFFTLAALTFYAIGYGSWKYSFIGDEYAFFWAAEGIAKKGVFNFYWFNANGVYRIIPESLSIFQAIFIKAFEFYNTNFGWRLSSSILTLVCAVPLYLIIKTILAGKSSHPRTSAFVGISIFFFSDLITVWSRVAQQPNSGLFPIIFGTCFLLAAIRRRSMFYFFLTGLVWGMGLILNILGPVIAGGVIGSILLFDLIRSLPQIKESRILVFAPCLLVSCGLLIASFPNLVQKDYYQALNQHVLHSKEDPGSVESRSRKTLQTNL